MRNLSDSNSIEEENIDFGYNENDGTEDSFSVVNNIARDQQNIFVKTSSDNSESTAQKYSVEAKHLEEESARNKTGRAIVVLVTITVFVIAPIIAIIMVVTGALTTADSSKPDGNIPQNNGGSASNHDYLLSADYYWDKDTDWATGQPYVAGNEGSDVIKDRWKSGVTWLPEPVSEPQTEDFSTDYPTATDFIEAVSTNTELGVHVIFSSDPNVNCGMKDIRITDKTVAGCYNPAYGNALIMYWGTEAPLDVRTLVAFHMFSHFVQHWEGFEYVYSTYKSVTDGNEKNLARIIEQDSSCRVYYGWGNKDFLIYDRQLANPCGSLKSWNGTWLGDELYEAEIIVNEY